MDHDDRALAVALGLVARGLLAHTADTLRRVAVQLAPLKGVLFLLARPDLARPMIDVDALVHPNQAELAIRALMAVGYVERGRGDGTRTLRHPDFPMDLDLHWRLFQRGLFRLDAAGVLRRTTTSSLDGSPIRLLSPLDVYAHLVGHFVRGRHTADDARHVADFARVPTLWTIDARACADHLRSTGLDRAARYVLPIVITKTGDAFAAETLAALGADPLGEFIADRARALLARNPGNAPLGAVGCHALNASLPRAAWSLGVHLTRGALVRSFAHAAKRARAPG